MRNKDLDKKLPIDENIGELFIEGETHYRIVCGQKVSQIPEKTQDDIDLNLVMNRIRSVARG